MVDTISVLADVALDIANCASCLPVMASIDNRITAIYRQCYQCHNNN